MADHLFGEARAVRQGFQIKPGIDAHFLAHEDQILGADIARRRLVAGERTTAEAGDAGIETQPCRRASL